MVKRWMIRDGRLFLLESHLTESCCMQAILNRQRWYEDFVQVGTLWIPTSLAVFLADVPPGCDEFKLLTNRADGSIIGCLTRPIERSTHEDCHAR